MKNIFIIILTILFSSVFLAQVGIGTTTPNTNSILDLTNGSNQVLILPTTATPASNTLGSIYFNTIDSTLNYHNGIDYNSLSAWKFKFNGNNNLYTNENIGIGLSTPQTTLHVKGNGEILELEGTDNSFLSFYPKGHSNSREAFFGFNGAGTNDITLKNETATGTVIVDFTNSSGKLNVIGKVQERDHDLVPQGLISMWSGSSIPAGWVLCDGGTYPRLDGLGNVTAPDLRERFIVGAGRDGGAVFNNDTPSITQQANTDNTSVNGSGSTIYNTNATGSNNENKHTLSTAELPSHNHARGNLGGTASHGGSHFHEVGFDTGGGGAFGTAPNGVMTQIFFGLGCGASMPNNNPIANVASNSDVDGAHSHSVSITGFTANAGSSNSHENRPPYYALAFIMKL